MKYLIHSQVKRGSQYEILYSVLDDFNNLIVGNLTHTVGAKILTPSYLDTLFADVIYPQITDMLTPDDAQDMFTREEIETTLREKRYLGGNERWEDLAEN